MTAGISVRQTAGIRASADLLESRGMQGAEAGPGDRQPAEEGGCGHAEGGVDAERAPDHLGRLGRPAARADLEAGGAEGLGQLGADEIAHALPGDGAGQAGGEPAVGDGVVGGAAGGPLGGCGREPALHADVIEELVGVVRDGLHVVEPGSVAEQLADRDPVLAGGGELGPVAGNGQVVVDQAAVGEPVDHHRGESLGRGEAEGLGLGAPGALVCRGPPSRSAGRRGRGRRRATPAAPPRGPRAISRLNSSASGSNPGSTVPPDRAERVPRSSASGPCHPLKCDGVVTLCAWPPQRRRSSRSAARPRTPRTCWRGRAGMRRTPVCGTWRTGSMRARQSLLEANRADVDAGREQGLNEALLDRLTLTEARIAEMAKGVREIAELDDPVGEVVEGWTLENGLEVAKKRVPIGVVAVVYEARPNVTVDAAALCLKSGNAAVLRGSSSAESSNAFLAGLIAEALAAAELPAASVSLLSGGGHEQLEELATQEGSGRPDHSARRRGAEGGPEAGREGAGDVRRGGQLPCLRAPGRGPRDGGAGRLQREGAAAGRVQCGGDAAGAQGRRGGSAAEPARQAERRRGGAGR